MPKPSSGLCRSFQANMSFSQKYFLHFKWTLIERLSSSGHDILNQISFCGDYGALCLLQLLCCKKQKKGENREEDERRGECSLKCYIPIFYSEKCSTLQLQQISSLFRQHFINLNSFSHSVCYIEHAILTINLRNLK